MADKSADAFRTISEVAETIGVPQHVLRFWETRFPAVKPLKRGGNRRYYRPEDVELLRAINRLLYTDGYTIKGVQKLLKDKGAKGLLGEAAPTIPVSPAVTMPEAAAPGELFARPAQPTAVDAAFVTSLRAIRDRLAGALAQA
ncbi:MerR family transcriptional regulator [Sphingosinicella soli]|uniref:DNA-binding transcriptional MerR regulator n=1 Tax=Sphingosinicella soli TaxID=333708 RepID=A0A7W7B1H4_9SPHN|nr:MerR family transcriptional regulator [Sphingosinicella soli]MBB4632277.1 DNA-binding transcriptional MerR regulator [Sphingosinicella soli]